MEKRVAKYNCHFGPALSKLPVRFRVSARKSRNPLKNQTIFHQSPSMIRLNIKEIACIWTCLGSSSHRIVLPHGRQIQIGRSQNIDPEDEKIPPVQFLATANVPKRCVYVYMIAGQGFLNDEEMEENVPYTVLDGDNIGFNTDEMHQYNVSFTIENIDWPGPLND